jgi:Chromo (CHRromatin Organisation MOdifier) domain
MGGPAPEPGGGEPTGGCAPREGPERMEVHRHCRHALSGAVGLRRDDFFKILIICQHFDISDMNFERRKRKNYEDTRLLLQEPSPKRQMLVIQSFCNIITTTLLHYSITTLLRPTVTTSSVDMFGSTSGLEIPTDLTLAPASGGTYYLIHWKGYPKTKAQWTKYEDCKCDELIAEFEKKKKN